MREEDHCTVYTQANACGEVLTKFCHKLHEIIFKRKFLQENRRYVFLFISQRKHYFQVYIFVL